jgi:uncharacterized protein YigE (DUF2233 family)
MAPEIRPTVERTPLLMGIFSRITGQRRLHFLIVLLNGAALLVSLGDAASATRCVTTTYLAASYSVCTFEPNSAGIRLRHSGDQGPYETFRSLEIDLIREKLYLKFATNGGMYLDNLEPVGLFIETGIVRTPLNRADGDGNFYWKPNGVFYITRDQQPGVLETEAFKASGILPFYATQSGPMLVIKGKIHSGFSQSKSRLVRNGVGVSRANKVIFVMSDQPVRFDELARFFKFHLRCENALYLDGVISSVRVPEWYRRDNRYRLGPMITVEDVVPG